VEKTLHAELDGVLGGRTPAYTDLRALTYTDSVVREAMRLYPPAYFIGRMAIEETRIGEFDVPKGMQIGIATFATHRDARWWDRPDDFIPERWAEESERPKYAYLPFGAGPRVCIGNSFAMIEARLLLATLAQRFRLRLPPGTLVRTDPLITLRPKGGMPMRVERRPVPAPAAPHARAQPA
jgi:cytochrome P450